MRIINCYFNDEDFSYILLQITNCGAVLFDQNKHPANTLSAISYGIRQYYIGYEKENLISITPCYFSSRYLQCGSFCISDEKDKKLLSLFNLIKQMIRKTFILSSDATFYIGLGIYQEWVGKKYLFPVLFKYEEVAIEAEHISLLFKKIAMDGFQIHNNRVRLKNLNILKIPDASYVIFMNSNKPISTIINKSIMQYEYGSECIFVEGDKRLSKYYCRLDYRIATNPNSKVTTLFFKLKEGAYLI